VPRYLIGVGSSHPNGAEYIQRAFFLLSQSRFVEVVAASDTLMFPPAGGQTHFAFCNAAFALTTSLHPDALWFLISSVEHKLGRIRLYKNGPRTLDLDVLWCYESMLNTPHLRVPHPEFHKRPFALQPASDAARKAKWPPPTNVSEGHLRLI
jgi:2-amino-4-hydroxy-6-hydroxymethyldihydropteridine diphosphokinase